MGLSWFPKSLHKLATFGGEIQLITQLFLWLGSAGIVLVTIQFSLLDHGLAETHYSLGAIIFMILGGLAALMYCCRAAGRYTDERIFHQLRGQIPVVLIFFIFSTIAVLVINGGFLVFLQDVSFSSPALVDLLFLGLVTTGTATYLGIRSLHTLHGTYPSIDDIQGVFQYETEQAIENIYKEIEGIGPIDRVETPRIQGRLEEMENVSVTGEGGIGKSGILAGIAEAWNSSVLFIDASAHASIESETDLAEQIGREPTLDELQRPIRRISIIHPLLVVVDQLDDVGPTAGKAYTDFIRTVAEYDNTAVAFACRTHDLDSRPEFDWLSSAETFSTERTVGFLDQSDVRGYIGDLTGSNPPDEVVRLGRKIEHLDVIAELATEDVDFDNISGEVSLWEGYRKLLEHEEQLDDDSRRGDRVVRQAIEYAQTAIEDPAGGVNLFPIPADLAWEDRQLINRNVIEEAQHRPGERQYRFRHQGFPRYLYAWEAVQQNQSIQEVASQIDDRLGKDVFRFMFMLYLREGGAEHIGEIPAGSDASTYAKDFLNEALDEERGLGDYAAKTILDEVKTWDATANDELTDVVLEKLDERETLFNYFFGNPPHPSWAIALRDRGRLKNPPDVLIQYLRNLAPEHPEVVTEVLPAVEADDRHTLGLVVTVIRELPVDHAAEVVELVRDSVTETTSDWQGFQTTQLLEELVEAEEYQAGRTLLEALVTVREPRKGEPNYPQSVVDLYALKSTLDVTIEPLVDAQGEAVITLLKSELRTAVELEATVRNRDVDSILGPIDSPIGRPDLDDANYHNIKDLLLDAQLIALEQWIAADPTDPARKEMVEAYLNGITLFHRIGLYILNEYPEQYLSLVQRELQREENYQQTLIKEDFLRLLRDGYPLLSEEQQTRVLEIISACPVRETVEENVQEQSQDIEEYTAEELAEETIERWVRDRLWILQDYLPNEEQAELERLVDEHGEPDDVFSFISTSSGFVGQESPVPMEELLTWEPADVIDYCIDEPFESTGWEETEAGGLRETSPEGLAEAAAQVILHEPERFKQDLPRLNSANPVYTRELLRELREKIKDDESFAFDWEPFLELSEMVASNPDQWPPHVRTGVARLFRDALSSEQWETLFDYTAEVKEILLILSRDPDPAEEREHPPEGHAGFNNPLHVAINSTRPIGIEALLIFSLRLAERDGYQGFSNEDGSGFKPGIRERMQELIEDASISTRAIIGRHLHRLWHLDHDIVLENLSTIFPRSQRTRDKIRFSAAWDTYLASNQPHPDLFPQLRACYLHGIDLTVADENTAIQGADSGLARHLLTAYLKGMEPLNADDSSLRYLYDQDDPDIARQIAWQLWRWGKDNEDTREQWEKVRKLWEWRLDHVDEPHRYAAEFQWFIEWLPLIGDDVPFNELVDLLKATTPFVVHEHRAWETLETYLAEHVETHPEEAIKIYAELIGHDDRPDWLQFGETTITLLEGGIVAGGETEIQAIDIAEDYFTRGYNGAEAFLDEHT